jgi:hypothetical protein
MILFSKYPGLGSRKFDLLAPTSVRLSGWQVGFTVCCKPDVQGMTNHYIARLQNFLDLYKGYHDNGANAFHRSGMPSSFLSKPFQHRFQIQAFSNKQAERSLLEAFV